MRIRISVFFALLAYCGGMEGFGAPNVSPPQQVITLHPDIVSAQSLMAQKKWGDAAIVLRAWIKDFPSHPNHFDAVIELARCLVHLGRREEALTLLNTEPGGLERGSVVGRRVIVLGRLFMSPETQRAFQEAEQAVEAGKTGAAREKFEKLLEVEPFNVEVIESLARSLLIEGDYDSAIEKLKYAKKLSPPDPRVRLWLGRALLLRGDSSEALAELRVAEQEFPGSEAVALWIAEAYVRSNQRSAAITFLEKKSTGSPYQLELLLELARIRVLEAPRDVKQLWSARRELQLILSRIDQPEAKAKEGANDPGVRPRVTSEELKKECWALLQQVDERIDQEKSRGGSKGKA